MITAEKRRQISVVPVVSTGIAATALALAAMALWLSTGQGWRVRYVDGQYLVSGRYPGQWHEIRDFIQPDDPDVIAIYGETGPDVWACLDWVCRNIAYRQDITEWWSFPAETINRGSGDCEDSAFLVCSLLKNFTNAHVALGNCQGYSHSWCQLDGQIFETTYIEARPVPNPQHYFGYVYFNNQEVIELWPGALRDVFRLRRNEATKLNLMAKALQNG